MRLALRCPAVDKSCAELHGICVRERLTPRCSSPWDVCVLSAIGRVPVRLAPRYAAVGQSCDELYWICVRERLAPRCATVCYSCAKLYKILPCLANPTVCGRGHSGAYLSGQCTCADGPKECGRESVVC